MDTTLGACSVVVCVDGRVIAHSHEPMRRGHAEALVPMVREAVARAGLRIPDLDRIAVTVGPGSFTGVRVGLAAARGFSLASGVPLVGVTTLDALAAGAVRHLPGDGIGQTIIVAIDARRGEIYRRCFRRSSAPPHIEPLGPAEAIPVGQADRQLPGGPGILIGTGAGLVDELIRARNPDILCPGLAPEPDALDVAELGLYVTPGEAPPAPLYLRPPDAKLPAAATAPHHNDMNA